MAHGGLALAGKVRSATPKVAKKERASKKKTGRALKREKYDKLMARQQGNSRDGPNKQKKNPMLN